MKDHFTVKIPIVSSKRRIKKTESGLNLAPNTYRILFNTQEKTKPLGEYISPIEPKYSQFLRFPQLHRCFHKFQKESFHFILSFIWIEFVCVHENLCLGVALLDSDRWTFNKNLYLNECTKKNIHHIFKSSVCSFHETKKMFNMLLVSSVQFTQNLLHLFFAFSCMRSFENWIINVSHTKSDAQRWSSVCVFVSNSSLALGFLCPCVCVSLFSGFHVCCSLHSTHTERSCFWRWWW